ncbi:MAG: fused MFS/spermidine synthase [Candidatus Omnitrophica bacterium]|nr:fused MFS/spermidine synthase [Candidatus Omnitrophota bacterium]
MTLVLIKAVVFISGCVLMSLEIAGSRILAPYFGNTIFVWSSLISVLLMALAGGYYAGGRLADRKPSFRLWAVLLCAAGLATAAVPFIAGPVNRMLLFRLGVGDRAGVLAASALIFFLPSLALGIVSPFAVKFSVKHISRVGNVTGELYAWSALGNVLGTLFTAFFLISRMGVFTIFVVLGCVLLAVSGLVFLLTQKPPGPLASFLIFIAAASLFFLPLPPLVETSSAELIVFQKDSFYNHLVVSDDPVRGVRKLRFDREIEQTGIELSGNYGSIHDTTSFLHLPVAFFPQMKNVLFLGCGGGIVPRNYFCDYPGIEIDVVEIDPLVVRVSRDYFFFFPAPRIHVHIDDGRRFIQRSDKAYDVVVIDVFNSAGHIPFHLLTREFFGELYEKMSGNGVVALNLISPMEGEGGALYRAVYKTLSSVFPQVYVFPVVLSDPWQDRTKPMNIIMVAVKERERRSPQELYDLIAAQTHSGFVKVPQLEEAARFCRDVAAEEMERADLLTDDFSPVELLYEKSRR